MPTRAAVVNSNNTHVVAFFALFFLRKTGILRGMEIFEREPGSFIIGDTIRWRRAFSEYPASAWALSYTFTNAGARKVVDATADGDAYLITISAEDSAAWTPGAYLWQAAVSNETERYTVAVGRTIATANYAAYENGVDGRSDARKILDAIDAKIAGRATQGDIDVVEYNIGIRGLRRSDPDALIKLRAIYAFKVWQEANPGEFAPTVQGTFG